MFEIVQSATFYNWLVSLKDQQARMRIHARLDRVVLGNLGDAQPWAKGLPSCEYIAVRVIGYIVFSAECV